MRELKKDQLDTISAGTETGKVPSFEEAMMRLLENRTYCPVCGREVALYGKFTQSVPYPGWNNTLIYICDCDTHLAGIATYYQDEDRWEFRDY